MLIGAAVKQIRLEELGVVTGRLGNDLLLFEIREHDVILSELEVTELTPKGKERVDQRWRDVLRARSQLFDAFAIRADAQDLLLEAVANAAHERYAAGRPPRR